ncbi:MAG TPA: class I SAM-dependent methyltransferase [Thermoanaerobaculia bacterium]|nr:class I SAM-dependent methyltransferase [Thermoanaerobaculia bacterium]
MDDRLPSFDKRACARDLASDAARLPRAERTHLAVRFRSAPWERILPALSPHGALCDVGCGPGVLAYLLARYGFTGTYLGLDPDERKVARAKEWPGGTPSRRFEKGSVEAAPEGAFDQVVVVDVLYLVAVEEREAFLRRAASALQAKGRLVVVTSGGGPPWKRLLDRMQERVAVSLLGLTRGASVAPCDGREIAVLMNAVGLAGVSIVPIGSGYLHGFELVTGTKP